MPTKQTTKRNLDRLRNPPSVAVPGTKSKVNLPGRPALAWYAGIATMAAVEWIEWPVALIVAGTHFIENHTHNRNVQELAEGIEAGA